MRQYEFIKIKIVQKLQINIIVIKPFKATRTTAENVAPTVCVAIYIYIYPGNHLLESLRVSHGYLDVV